MDVFDTPPGLCVFIYVGRAFNNVPCTCLILADVFRTKQNRAISEITVLYGFKSHLLGRTKPLQVITLTKTESALKEHLLVAAVTAKSGV